MEKQSQVTDYIQGKQIMGKEMNESKYYPIILTSINIGF